MEALSVRDYRTNLSASFDRADNGDPVMIRRKNNLYALVCIGREELVITPALRQRIEEARKNYQEGNYTACKTAEELTNFLDSL